MFKRMPLAIQQTAIYCPQHNSDALYLSIDVTNEHSFSNSSRVWGLELLSTIAMLGSVMVGLGLEDALFRFSARRKTVRQQRKVTANIFALSVMITVVSLFGLPARPY